MFRQKVVFWFAIFVSVLVGTYFFPTIRLFGFSPLLALLIYHHSFSKALWIATMLGLTLDLLSSEMFFGAHALIFCLTFFIFHHYHKPFLAPSVFSLGLLTTGICFFSSLLYWIFFSLFQKPLPYSYPFLLTDLIGISLADGLYACILSHFLLKKRPRRSY